MIDCGVTYHKIEDRLYDIKYLLITHTHTDHLKVVTYNRIRKHFPRIKTIANWQVAAKVDVDRVVGDETIIKLKDRTIRSFPCVHDVVTHGFVIFKGDTSIIYATDTASLEHAPKAKYDMLFLESNHDEKKLDMIRNGDWGYDAWKGAMRHLSTQKSKAFYYMNRKDTHSEWIELHKSKRFY